MGQPFPVRVSGFLPCLGQPFHPKSIKCISINNVTITLP